MSNTAPHAVDDHEEPAVLDESSETDEELPFTYDITAYGADYPVDGLVMRLGNGDIVIPDFQRSYVWTKRQSDRFIESLLLGLPVPGIFLARSQESTKLLVLDGQQRLRTLADFYRGIFRGREFTLEHVQQRLIGKSYQTLDEEDRRRLDDSIIHATVVRQDQPSEDQSSIYFIFERINTGGTELAPQEIRAALYQGSFNDLLHELNAHENWRSVYGRASNRLKDQELILRFLSLKHERARYERPMEQFLNSFMASNRRLDRARAEQFSKEFISTIDVVSESMGRRAFRPAQAINAAIYDSVMIGISDRIEHSPAPDVAAIVASYEELLANDAYLDACSKATSDVERVSTRLRLATEAFINT